MTAVADAVVIGGGFYGAVIAEYLRTVRGLGQVVLLEREARLLARSSFVNQARVHGGYHYPRSYTTAYRSRINMPRFRQDFGASVFDGFTSLYAIARRNSKVTVKQMERFCAEIGADLKPVDRPTAALFNPMLIERAWVAEEQAFNADALRDVMTDRLARAGVDVRLNAEAAAVEPSASGVVVHGRRGGDAFSISTPMVFNCTYSRLQHTVAAAAPPDFRLRHEIAELVLVEPPAPLRSLGVTVMDGAYFSIVPFPARGLHSLTHVRYTPHLAWGEDPSIDPYDRLDRYPKASGVDWMIRDSARYLPCLSDCRPVSTLFEVKTVLMKNENDDGRPILFERHGPGGRLFSILGGKIDNVYDILESMDRETLPDWKEAA